MPHRQPPSPVTGPPPKQPDFRQRYEDVEVHREQLLKRLNMMGDKAKAHPGYKRALKLLNDTFRKTKLAQRAAVLQAASWLIDILEHLTFML
jgi:hypothetical protein